MITEINDLTYAEHIDASEGAVVIIDFYAAWCAPCKMIAPLLESLDEELTEVEFFKVDVDKNPDLVSAYEIRSMPTLVRIDEGGQVERKVGASNKRDLKDFIVNGIKQF